MTQHQPDILIATDNEDTDVSVSMLDIMLFLSERKAEMIKVGIIFGLIGTVLALALPLKYSSSARLIRETIGDNGSTLGLGGSMALRSLGLNLGGGSVGLTADTYPDIIRSREVGLAVLETKYQFATEDSIYTLTEYFKRDESTVRKTVSALKKIPHRLAKLIRPEPDLKYKSSAQQINMSVLTEDQAINLKTLRNMVGVGVDIQTGIMNIKSTTKDPLLSAQLTQAVINELSIRVQTIFTEKARADLEFLKLKFDEANTQLLNAEDLLATFVDENRNPQSANLLVEKTRLERQVNFKSQLYTEFQNQYTAASIDLQKMKPVITLLESPMIPTKRSAPRRIRLVVLMVILGIGIGIIRIFLMEYLRKLALDNDDAEKIQSIKKSFTLKIWKAESK